jgi:hypothetical protein
MEEVVEEPTTHIPHIPHKSDQRIYIEAVDCQCGVMISHGVIPTLVHVILRVPNMSMIWTIMPRDMMLFIHYILYFINILEGIMDLTHTSHDSTSFDSSPY